ncbi:uncharacterized protein LOC110991252 [Acanthaster planci]|uniref:Uncharacterized protein LOC110991252 n=1 Tax=Acanthaster planci TaxID=133434 RepID=A0A8B8A3F4_ACAPL|nr:uncharacterized protein LOC110991252 [Acanthaster planci]
MTTPKLSAVINFYEKITPPPDFATFVDGWKSLGQYVETLDHYIAAQLHRNIDEKGLFPYANFSTFTGSHERIINDFMHPDPELIKAVVKGHGMPGVQVNHPGGYDEIATLEGKPIIPDMPARLDSLFILSAFRSKVSDTELSNSGDLEKEWLRWTGITAVKEAAPAGVRLGTAGLYKRFTPGEPYKAVTYVMRCELLGLKENFQPGLEVVKIIKETGAPEGLELVDSALYCLDEDTISVAAKSK